MIGKDFKVSLGDEDWLNVCFYGPREEKPYLPPNYIAKQMNYHVSNALNIRDFSTTLGISISIFTIGGFRDGSSEDYEDCFSQRNIDFISTYF